MSDFDKQQLGVRAASDSVDSGNNNSGLTLALDGHGRSIVNVAWTLGSSATVTLEGRNPTNGLNEWREIASYDTSTSNYDNTDRESESDNAFEEYRVTTSTTGIDIDFEISATR